MAFAARLEITTFQDGKSEKLKGAGEITFENDSTFIEFSSGDNTRTRIGLSPGVTTVTKLGDESYTLVLEDGKVNGTILNLGSQKLDMHIRADKSVVKKTGTVVDALLSYTVCLGGNEIFTKVRIKCDYSKEAQASLSNSTDDSDIHGIADSGIKGISDGNIDGGTDNIP